MSDTNRNSHGATTGNHPAFPTQRDAITQLPKPAVVKQSIDKVPQTQIAEMQKEMLFVEIKNNINLVQDILEPGREAICSFIGDLPFKCSFSISDNWCKTLQMPFLKIMVRRNISLATGTFYRQRYQ
jgi:hypothetical protein